MNYQPKAILYISGNQNLSAIASYEIRKAFRNYKVITSDGTKEDIDKAVQEIGGIEKIALTCADHILSSGRRAWHAAEYLRRKGYKGEVIWMGHQKPPEEKKDYFQDIAPKRGLNLINHIRRRLNQ